jgi:hypothetical protein
MFYINVMSIYIAATWPVSEKLFFGSVWKGWYGCRAGSRDRTAA